ncbi:hypothetical protein KKG41_06615 [Patescibacteria group bacterium]|nr:hypothetical protein [Patescibacteria group bacterium]MBU1890671.1 hypothetical protein [Patescibacteria group bacterium]
MPSRKIVQAAVAGFVSAASVAVVLGTAIHPGLALVGIVVFVISMLCRNSITLLYGFWVGLVICVIITWIVNFKIGAPIGTAVYLLILAFGGSRERTTMKKPK